MRVGSKNLSLVITVCHHSASLVMSNGDPQGRFFDPILTQILDSFSCSPLKILHLLEKLEKDFQKILNTLRCDTMTSLINVRPACRCSIFYLSLGLVWVCEIEIHTWVKTWKSRSGVRESYIPHSWSILFTLHKAD